MRSEEAYEQIAYMKDVLTKTRLRTATGYPFFVLWGIADMLGYIGSIWSNSVWPIVGMAGFIASGIVGRMWKWPKGNTRLLAQLGVQAVVLALAQSLIFALLIHEKVYWVLNAYWPFQIGIIYVVAGIFMGRDLVRIGSGMVLASVISLFIPVPYQNIWLGVVAGGGLFITGVIFRKQVKSSGE